MEKRTSLILLAIILTIGVVVGYNLTRIADSLEATESAGCPYEGAECPNVQEHLREYQIELTEAGSYIYDYDRLVGFIPHDTTSAYNKLMLKDNL